MGLRAAASSGGGGGLREAGATHVPVLNPVSSALVGVHLRMITPPEPGICDAAAGYCQAGNGRDGRLRSVT